MIISLANTMTPYVPRVIDAVCDETIQVKLIFKSSCCYWLSDCAQRSSVHRELMTLRRALPDLTLVHPIS